MKKPHPDCTGGKRFAARGFTLLELLTVVAILMAVAIFVAPSVKSITGGTNLNRAGQLIGDQWMLARQETITNNCEVRVLFYNFQDTSTKGWRGIQLFRVKASTGSSTLVPITRLLTVPEGIVINADATLSPLLNADSSLAETVGLQSHGAVQSAGFRFRATGLPDSSVTDTNNFITLNDVHAQGNPPANYYTLQINPVTGKVTVFRP